MSEADEPQQAQADDSLLEPIDPEQEEDEALRTQLVQLQGLLQKVPDELLVAEMANRVERDPKREVRQIVQQVSTFHGPLPPPSMLAQYNDVHEGLAERIVQLTEKQQAHRIKMESDSVSASIWSERLGQIFAFILGIVIIAGSFWLINNGKEVAGSLLGGGTLTGVLYIFITGRRESMTTKKQDVEQD